MSDGIESAPGQRGPRPGVRKAAAVSDAGGGLFHPRAGGLGDLLRTCCAGDAAKHGTPSTEDRQDASGGSEVR